MPVKTLGADVKNRSGRRTVQVRISRGRTRSAIMTVRTNGTTGNFIERTGGQKTVHTGRSLATAPKQTNVVINR